MSNILYAPWRLNYILSEKDDNCIFCLKPHTKDDEKNLILFRTTHSFVIMNMFPYNNGHIMVVPNRHVATLSSLSSQEVADLFQLVQLCEKIINNVYNPEGINIGLNLGKAAGAGIDDHLHVHMVPRWIGDVNFMSSIGGTRVIPEEFERAYFNLKEQFDNEHLQK